MRTIISCVAALLSFGCTPSLAEPTVVAQPPRVRFKALSLGSLALPFKVRSVVARVGGGAFVLGEGGELGRVGPRGQLTGIYATNLRALLGTSQFVCGADHSGQVYCSIDHHADFTCRETVPAPVLTRLKQIPEGPLRHDKASDALCIEGRGKATACFHVRASCERHCLAWPPCAPARCIDPCPPGAAPSLYAVPIFSASSAPAGTEGG